MTCKNIAVIELVEELVLHIILIYFFKKGIEMVGNERTQFFYCDICGRY